MTICIIGNDGSGTLERFYEEGLVALGAEVSWLPIRKWWDENRSNIIAKVVSRIAPRIFCRDINNRVLEFVRKNRPDTVLIFKGMELFPETVNSMKSLTRTVK